MRKVLVAACALALAIALPTGAGGAGAATVGASDLLALQNELRFSIGAPTIPADPRVVSAAQHHAEYSSLNGASGHFETPGLPGFTGAAPRDRVAAAGSPAAIVSEVATSGLDALAAVRQLWDAPYHRLGLMHPNAVAAGWGHADLNGRSSTVGNFTYDFGIRPVAFVRSPASGQAGIPTSWDGRESPTPLPAGVRGPVGYPIMVVYSAGQRVEMRAAELIAPGGTRLPIYYAPQLFEYDYEVIVPQRPLPAATTLHVRFDITVNGVWLTNEWDFTTAGSGGSLGSPAQRAAPAGELGYHSRWLSETAFPSLGPGATSAPLTIAFTNAGTRPWVRGVLGQQANLGVNGDDRSFSVFGTGWPTPDRVAIQNEPLVQPGGTGTFTFRVRAPVLAGTYAIHLRPVIDGTVWMEDEGVYLLIAVR